MSRQDDLQKQIAEHQRRLQLLKQQRARQGINTDPAVITEIEDIEATIKELQAELNKSESDTERQLPVIYKEKPVAKNGEKPPAKIGFKEIATTTGGGVALIYFLLQLVEGRPNRGFVLKLDELPFTCFLVVIVAVIGAVIYKALGSIYQDSESMKVIVRWILLGLIVVTVVGGLILIVAQVFSE